VINNYFVVLASADLGDPVMSFYLHKGRSFDTMVPTGQYLLRVAKGNTWCSEKRLFGIWTETSETASFLSFDLNDGYTVDLAPPTKGNLPTRRMHGLYLPK
jgi:hypothetical protein